MSNSMMTILKKYNQPDRVLKYCTSLQDRILLVCCDFSRLKINVYNNFGSVDVIFYEQFKCSWSVKWSLMYLNPNNRFITMHQKWNDSVQTYMTHWIIPNCIFLQVAKPIPFYKCGTPWWWFWIPASLEQQHNRLNWESPYKWLYWGFD